MPSGFVVSAWVLFGLAIVGPLIAAGVVAYVETQLEHQEAWYLVAVVFYLALWIAIPVKTISFSVALLT